MFYNGNSIKSKWPRSFDLRRISNSIKLYGLAFNLEHLLRFAVFRLSQHIFFKIEMLNIKLLKWHKLSHFLILLNFLYRHICKTINCIIPTKSDAQYCQYEYFSLLFIYCLQLYDPSIKLAFPNINIIDNK